MAKKVDEMTGGGIAEQSFHTCSSRDRLAAEPTGELADPTGLHELDANMVAAHDTAQTETK